MASPESEQLSMILIAELHRAGLFDAANLASMAKRLEDAGEGELAERVISLPLSNALTDPDAIRASVHCIRGGKPDK